YSEHYLDTEINKLELNKLLNTLILLEAIKGTITLHTSHFFLRGKRDWEGRLGDKHWYFGQW
ncbi:hypothetical protein, partial [Neisseria meningitidis]|uniref:hypothetical protein n=1 Tax=Neisseria meningitidis TaxID=487 RepID=UPI001E4FA85F